MNIKNRLKLIKGYDLILCKDKKDFEIKVIDTFTGESLIIDNSFISKAPLKLKDYIPLCKDIVNKLIQGFNLSQLSIQ